MRKASSSPSLPSVVGSHSSHPRRQPLTHSVPALPDDMHRERSCPKPPWDFGDRKEGKTIHSNNIYKNWAKYSRSFKSCSTSQHKLVHFQLHKRLPCLTAGRTSSQFRGTDSKRTFKGVDLSTARCWHRDSNKVSDTFTEENLTQCDVLRLNQLISLMEPLRSGKHHLHVTWDSYNGLLESPCNWVVEFPTRNKRPGLTDHRTFGEAYPLYRKTRLVYKGRAVLVWLGNVSS